MTRVARIRAQAKVNLTLIVGPRDDTGYHEIFTLFQRLDLADDIVVRASAGSRSLDAAGPRVPSNGLGPVEKNLAWRAATAYMQRAGWPDGFAIELTKHIPVGGGLGGGSADAAGVLRALDAMAPSPLGQETLAAIAAGLGADVPFLVSPHALAGGAGRGEVLYPEDPLPAVQVALLLPSFGVSTADAYRWLDESRASASGGSALGRGIALRVPEMTVESWDEVAAASMNHFEDVVERRHPALAEYRRRLEEQGAFLSRLAGSGSTVFGLFDDAVPNVRTDATVIPTRTSDSVVQVEVLE